MPTTADTVPNKIRKLIMQSLTGLKDENSKALFKTVVTGLKPRRSKFGTWLPAAEAVFERDEIVSQASAVDDIEYYYQVCIALPDNMSNPERLNQDALYIRQKVRDCFRAGPDYSSINEAGSVGWMSTDAKTQPMLTDVETFKGVAVINTGIIVVVTTQESR